MHPRARAQSKLRKQKWGLLVHMEEGWSQLDWEVTSWWTAPLCLKLKGGWECTTLLDRARLQTSGWTRLPSCSLRCESLNPLCCLFANFTVLYFESGQKMVTGNKYALCTRHHLVQVLPCLLSQLILGLYEIMFSLNGMNWLLKFVSNIL